MRETVVFRIPTENVVSYLPAGTGEALGYGVTRVAVKRDDPLYSEIGRLHHAFRVQGKFFISGWAYHRRYSRRELNNAELFNVWPKRAFEPAGEECGTVYDETSACDHVFAPGSEIEIGGRSVAIPASTCGAGARQVSSLFLDGRRIPRLLDFARTIADEVVVSRRVVELFREQELTGAEFKPIRLANEGGSPSQDHHQLTVVGASVQLDPATRAGDDPFDAVGNGRCPRSHVVGLNLLSEVTVTRESLSEADVMATRQMVGDRRGLLRPRPILLITRKAWRMIETAKLKGLTIEIAHIS